MMMVAAVLVVVALPPPQPFVATFAALAPCNCIIYRLDDIQDYWIDLPQMAIMDTFTAKHQQLSLSVIVSSIGNDAPLVDKIRKGGQDGVFALDSQHGWEHVDYRTLSPEQQKDSLVLANNRMQLLFDKRPIAFVAPADAFDTNTLSAMESIGMKIISSYYNFDTYPFFNAGGSSKYDGNRALAVVHMPGTASYTYYDKGAPGGWVDQPIPKILGDIDTAIAKYGYAVMVLHPQSFAQMSANGTLLNLVNQTEIARLSGILDAVAAKGIRSTTFSSLLAEYYSGTTVPPQEPSQPVLTLSPSTAAAGSVVMTTVQNYPPNDHVTLSANSDDAGEGGRAAAAAAAAGVLATIVTDTSGKGSAAFLASAPPAAYNIVATGTSATAATTITTTHAALTVTAAPPPLSSFSSPSTPTARGKILLYAL
jgi:peptidoglycan/xylan/chitin deacetylase (PgdA/CDA1 family)